MAGRRRRHLERNCLRLKWARACALTGLLFLPLAYYSNSLRETTDFGRAFPLLAAGLILIVANLLLYWPSETT